MQEKKRYYISCKGNTFWAGTEIKSTLTHKQFNVLGFFLRFFFMLTQKGQISLLMLMMCFRWTSPKCGQAFLMLVKLSHILNQNEIVLNKQKALYKQRSGIVFWRTHYINPLWSLYSVLGTNQGILVHFAIFILLISLQ